MNTGHPGAILARKPKAHTDGPTEKTAGERKGLSVEGMYDETALQSLFGYGREAHKRSGGICQLCGCGAGPEIDFDLWRQLTIEHLIGRSQGGYLDRIRPAVDRRFLQLGGSERESLASQIHEANIVTACQFCNSTTSRDVAPFTMDEAIADLPSDPEDALLALADKLNGVLAAKQSKVRWKLQSVYRGFRETIQPELSERRRQESGMREPRALSNLDAPTPPPTL